VTCGRCSSLTDAVLALIGDRPKNATAKAQPFLSSTTAGGWPFSGFSKALAVLVDRIVHPHTNVMEFRVSAASAG
jgi:hypothetical protein